MLEFLNPTFLTLAAAAAAIPVLIHLIKRNKAVRLEFAAMRFLLGSVRPVMRWLRLKQWLILLLRIAAVVLLGLAFARPYLASKSSIGLWDSARRDVGIIVDVSASMAAAENLAAAKTRLADLLQSIDRDALVTLCLVGGGNRFIADRTPFSRALARKTLADLQPTHGTANLREALQSVDDLLRGSPRLQKDIYLISDFQKGTWPEGELPLQLASNAEVHVLPVAEERWPNIGIASALVPAAANEPWRCTIRDYSGGSIAKFRVELHLDGKRLASQTLEFNGERLKIVEFAGVTLPAQAFSGKFQIRAAGDAFAGDDQFYFSMHKKQRLHVLAINGEAAPGVSDELYFVRKAFAVSGSRFDLLETVPSRLNEVNPAAFDLVLLANVQGLNRSGVQALQAFVKNGGGLLIAPGDRVQPEGFNRMFADLAPARLSSRANKRLDRRSGSVMFFTQTQHPAIERIAAATGSILQSTYFFQYWRVQPTPQSEVVARFADSAPAMVTGNVGQGKVVLLAFPLDAEWSELPAKAAFLPILYGLADYAKPAQDGTPLFVVHEPIFIGDRFAAGKPIAIEMPDRSKRTLPAGQLIFSATDLPGIYSIRQDGRVRQFAVNVDRAESETRLLPATAFLAKIDKANEPLSVDRSVHLDRQEAQQSEQKQKIWRFFLAAAFLALVAETILANRTPR